MNARTRSEKLSSMKYEDSQKFLPRRRLLFSSLLLFFLSSSFMSVSTLKKSKYTQMDFVIHSREKKTSNLCCWKSLKVILELIISVFQKFASNFFLISWTKLRLEACISRLAWSLKPFPCFKLQMQSFFWKEFLTLCKPLKSLRQDQIECEDCGVAWVLA